MTWATAVDPITGAPADSINEYPPDAAQLIAAIPASALPAGATIDAAWFYNDTSLDAFNTRVALPDGAARRWVDLHLSRKDDTPWPDGTYEVVVSLNGVEVQRSSVSVVSGN